jgi:phosphopantetheinyl transferase
MDSTKMNLVLLHVDTSADVWNGDEQDDDDDVARVLEHWQGSTARCCSARCYLSQILHDSNVDVDRKLCSCENGCAWNKVRHDVVKFVQHKDRLLALASILLKSRTFHETYSLDDNARNSDSDHNKDENDNTQRAQNSNHQCQLSHQRTIVDLPRTIYGKPYIPVDTTLSSAVTNETAALAPFDEETVYPFSLSHQYPFCGLVRRWDKCHCGKNDEQHSPMDRSTRQTNVGMDIVVFDPINTRLYDSVFDFCEALSGNFTAREYNDNIVAPHMDEASRLRELYLRWTIKEAYTKALGVGMGYDFGSLEIILDGPTHTVWNWLSAQAQIHKQPVQQLSTTGTVLQLSTGPALIEAINGELPPLLQRPDQEMWRFIFLPLYDVCHTTDTYHDFHMRGCACVCVGPFADFEGTEDVPLTVEWTSLVDLASWHGLSHQ